MTKKIKLTYFKDDDLVDELEARGYDWIEKVQDRELIDEVRDRDLVDNFYEGLDDLSDEELHEEIRSRNLISDADDLREIKQAVLEGDFDLVLLRLDQLLPNTHRYLDD